MTKKPNSARPIVPSSWPSLPLQARPIFWALLLLCALAFLFLCSLFPPLGDDFNRLRTLFMPYSERWTTFLQTYQTLNGRLLGNFLSLFFIAKPLQLLAKLATFSALLACFFALFRQKSTPFVTLALLLFLPRPIFREAVAWNAGFFNYAPNLAIILFLCTRYARPQDRPFSMAEALTVFLCAYSACLFTENVSLYLAVMPLLAWFFFRRPFKNYLPGLIGGLLGNLILFSSPVYHTIAQGSDGYRSLPHQGLVHVLNINGPVFAKFFLPIGLLYLFALLLLAHYRHHRKPWTLLSLFLLFFLYICRKAPLPYGYTLIGQCLFFLSLLPVLYPLTHHRLALFALFSLGAGMLPLLIVQPIGARNFLFAQVMEWLLLFTLYYSLPPLSHPKRRFLFAVVLLLILVQMGTLLRAYARNRRTYDANLHRLTQATLTQQSPVKLLPFPDPSFYVNPDWEKATNYLSFRYHKPHVQIQK